MQAFADLVLSLRPDGMTSEEVEVREDWRREDGKVYYGASIVDLGEQYAEGTCGTQDVGYLIGCVFAKQRTYDATLSDDRLPLWYETVRLHTVDERLGVDLSDDTQPKEHVMILMPGRTLTDPKNYPNYLIRQLVVSVWQREVNPANAA